MYNQRNFSYWQKTDFLSNSADISSTTSLKSTGMAVNCAPKHLKQINGKLKLKINADWNQIMKVIVTNIFKERKECFISLFYIVSHSTSHNFLMNDLWPTLYYFMYFVKLQILL